PRLLVHVTVRPQPLLLAATTPATAPGERTYTLLLGNSRGKSICAKLKRHPEVFTLPAAALDRLQPPLAELQSQTLLAFMPSQVDGIEVRQAAEHLALKRNGRWRMIQPFSGPVDDKSVDTLLEKLVGLKVQQWITPQTTGGIDITSPKATITLDLPQEDKKLSLLVGGKDPSGKLVYCKQSGASVVGTVEEDQIKAILQPAGHYWSKDLLKLPPGAEIISLSIDRPDGGYVLVRQGDQWLLTAPVKAPANAKQVRTILDQLRSVRAEKIVALGKTVPPQYASTEHRAVVSLGVTGFLDAKNAADTTQKSPPEKTIMKTYRLVVVQTDKGCFAWVENPAVTVVGRCSADLYDSLAGRLENSGKIA
ncbi:MAG: DUF4340 domain-containing protein, partial [Candidatus Hydrogenedentes bacterium]|nr:DUF4340 domain-containing protein [Candidatus Hydrogenedentota bacterium]